MSDAIYNYVTQSENPYYYYYDYSVYYIPIDSTASITVKKVPARDIAYENLYTYNVNSSYTINIIKNREQSD